MRAGNIEEALGAKLGFQIQKAKSFNMVIPPGNILGGVLRRADTQTRSTQMGLKNREQQLVQLNKDDDEMGRIQKGVFPTALESKLP